ncbi:hypothetical protein BDA96_07G194400 [Sorghum bicolor]|uniref:Uncharacterized protein n=1 Tax=Sorghum bicolor TaxID=4558 RepID=A0A921UAG2_SORBI|nr:hypothetical protein BDA96_07G194400 [Sorghum bicolor]
MKNTDYNLRLFASKPNAMMENMDKELRPRLAEQLNKHCAAIAIPQGLYCLLLRLTDEYSSNALAREQLPP